MKKTLLILLFAVASTWMYSQVQIGSSTSTSSSYPVNSWYDYSYSEQIYLQSEINAAGNIDTLSFYFDGGGSTGSSNGWTIYLGHTTKTDYISSTDWITSSGMTQVFIGTVTIPASGWFKIGLNTPFAYNNVDNLVVAIDENAAGWDGSGRDWRRSATGAPRSIYFAQDGTDIDPSAPGSADGTNSFVSNIIFGGIQQSCPALTTISSFATSFDSTNITWVSGANDSIWIIEYDTAGFVLGTGNTLNVSNDTATILGLMSNTDYDVYVRGICHVGDSSSWIGPLSLTTPCSPFLPSYQEDFASYVPDCWQEAAGRLGVANTTFTSTTSSIWKNGDYLYSGTNGKSAKINNYGTSNDEWLISPSIDLGAGAIQYQVEFDVALTNYNSVAIDSMGVDDTLALLISTDNGMTWNQANIVDLWTKDSSLTNTGEHVVYDLSSYTGVVKFGFYAASSVSNTDYDLYVNKFWVREIPTCPEPMALNSFGTTDDSTNITWTSGVNDSVWFVEYGETGFVQGTGTTVISNNDTLAINGLSSTTTYQVYLKSICHVGDSSIWVGPISLTTTCPASYTPSYLQDFASFVPDCWEEAQGRLGAVNTTFTSTTSSGWRGDDYLGNGSNGQAAVINNYGTSRDEWLISPSIDLGAGAIQYQVEFDYGLTNYNSAAIDSMGNDDSVAFVISIDNGTTWSQANILELWDTTNAISNTGQKTVIDLSAYTGVVKFGFYAASSASNTDYDFHVEDFWIREIPSCPEADSLAVINIGTDSVELTWQAEATDSIWIIEYDTAGFAQGTGNIHNASNDTTSINGLTDNTTYDAYLRSVCHVGDSSIWIGPITFTTDIKCAQPTTVSDFLIARDSNNITWGTNLTDSSYFIEWDTNNFVLGTGNASTELNDTVALTGLAPNTTYDFYIRTLCKTLDTSIWVGPYTFTTLVSCPTIDSIYSFGTLTDSSNVTWVAGPYDSTYIVEWDTAGFAHGAGTIVNLTTDTIGINGLAANSTYEVYVKSICTAGDTSDWFGPFEVNTLCAIYTPTYLENFTTYLPTCWEEANGVLNTNSNLTYSNSSWEGELFANAGTDSSAKLNLWSSSHSEWLISPTIDLGNGSTPYILEFDMAVTDFGGTAATNFDADDRVVILISEDNGATWSDTNSLLIFNNTTPISNTGDHHLYDLSADGFTGMVKFAVYAESKTYTADNDVFIDNFAVNLRPSCLQPLALSSFDIGTDSAYVTWSGSVTDSSYVIEYGPAGFALGAGTIVNSTNDTALVSSLQANTLYDFYVKTICPGNDTSFVSSSSSFNTACLTIVSLPYTETFDDTSSTQNCWTVINNNNDATIWDMDDAGDAYAGTEGASINTDFNGGANDDYLISPRVTLTGNERIRFFTKVESSLEPNDYEIVVSSTGTNPADFSTVVASETISSTTYIEKIYNLNAYTGNYYVAVKIPNGGLDGWILYIDEFTIEEIPSCPKASNLIAYDAGTDSVQLTWTPGVNDSVWLVEFGPKGFAQGTGTTVSASNDTTTVSGLAADVEYDFYLRSVCHVGDSSVWIGPAVDTTLPLCVRAQAFSVLSSDSSSINVGWNVDASHASYIVEYGPKGFAQGTGTTQTTAYPNNFLSIGGLNSSTEYDFYIKSVCNSGDTSSVDGPHSGTTDCSTLSLPWSEGFEGLATLGADLVPLCMLSDGDWVSATGTDTYNRGPRTDTNYMHVNFSADDWLFTPTFNMDTNGVYEVSVWYNTDGNNGWDSVSIFAGNNQTSGAMTELLVSDLDPTHTTYQELKGYFKPTTAGVYTFGVHVEAGFSPWYLSFDDFNVRDTNNVAGINELNNIAQFRVYPNPNNGEFTLWNEGNSLNTTVTILDIQGRVMYDNNHYFSHNARRKINLTNVNTGIYVLQIKNEGRIEQHRIIID